MYERTKSDKGLTFTHPDKNKRFRIELDKLHPCDMCSCSDNIILGFDVLGSGVNVHRLCFACIHDCIEEAHEQSGFAYTYRPKGLEIEVVEKEEVNGN